MGLALAAAPALAAEVTTEGTSSPRESPRALNAHVFQPSRLLTGPFSETSFGMATLFGAGQAKAPGSTCKATRPARETTRWPRTARRSTSTSASRRTWRRGSR